MTTTDKELIQQAIARRENKMYSYYKSVFVEGFDGGYPIEWDEELLSLAEKEWKQIKNE